jgi:hypothetical protein
MDDAVNHTDTNNGVTGPFQSSWYLTDVFAGFEIWWFERGSLPPLPPRVSIARALIDAWMDEPPA